MKLSLKNVGIFPIILYGRDIFNQTQKQAAKSFQRPVVVLFCQLFQNAEKAVVGLGELLQLNILVDHMTQRLQ